MDTRLNIKQQHAFVAKKTSGTLSSISQSISNTLREVILLLCSALVRPRLEYGVQFLAPQYKSDMDSLGTVQQRVMKIVKRLEHCSYEHRLRAGTVQPGEVKVHWGSSQCI